MSPDPALCRDCLTPGAGAGRCRACGSPRSLSHPELDSLAIAHVDADAFYAAVEKRDDPSLRDKPVIVGGGTRGVVSTACYIARLSGVRSAMPMFKARALCPSAIVVRPRMSRYVEVSRQIHAMMLELTPAVEPLSLDEAFLDLTGTARLHRAPPSALLARLQARIEAELGVTVSVGLSHNKFLAKIASELDKPRGFALIGRAETESFLGPRPIRLIWGIGPATAASLEQDGLYTIADLRSRDRKALVARYGSLGDRLWSLSRGQDTRTVAPDRQLRSISHETTFDSDISDPALLLSHLWDLTESVSARAKAAGLGGRTVTLKLRRADFGLLTRRETLASPTQMADTIFRCAKFLLHRTSQGNPMRLIGVGLSGLVPAAEADGEADLLDPDDQKRKAAERAADQVRARFGDRSIILGRSMR
jgi:DNA polymerase IV